MDERSIYERVMEILHGPFTPASKPYDQAEDDADERERLSNEARAILRKLGIPLGNNTPEWDQPKTAETAIKLIYAVQGQFNVDALVWEARNLSHQERLDAFDL